MTTTSYAIAKTHRRHASPTPLVLALGCCDIGRATLEDGRVVFTTWGRNLTRAEADHYARNTVIEPVMVGRVQDPDDRENFELILPDDQVEKLPLSHHGG